MVKLRGYPITADEARTTLEAVLVGVLVVPVIWALYTLSRYLAMLADYYVSPHLYAIVPYAAAVGLLAGIIIYRFSPEAAGPGMHISIAAYHRRDGLLRPRSGPGKSLATILTLSPGVVNGLLSPAGFMGNAVGSIIGRLSSWNKDKQRTMSLCGIAAAISTMLGTPIGAAIFAVEVVYGNRVVYKKLFFVLLASISAFVLSEVIGFRGVIFEVSELTFHNEVGWYVAFLAMFTSVGATLVSILHVEIYQFIHDFFIRWSWKGRDYIEPMMGLAFGVLLLIPFQNEIVHLKTVDTNILDISAVMTLSPTMLFLLLLVVILSSSIVAGSGASGGMFMPIIISGALIGALAGAITGVPFAGTLVVASISAALCTVLNIPLASAVIMVEVMGPSAALPAAMGSAVGYIMGRRFIIYNEIRWEELKKGSKAK